jgi:hypothetical protein
LLLFLLTYLHRIATPERQRELLDYIPAGMEIDASALIEISNVELEPLKNPILKAQPVASTVFIYSPLQRRSIELRCSVGDSLAFSITLTNPLAISITFDMISLIAINGIAHPRRFVLPALRKARISLIVGATAVGQLTVTGFTFVAGNLTGIHKFGSPITLDVIAELPQLIVKHPARFERRILENSTQRHTFELVNPSDFSVSLKSLSFGSPPPVLTSASLPIAYPPIIDPPLLEALGPGESRAFSLCWPCDRTLNVLSYAIEYGTPVFSRRFEMNEELEVLPGPHISSIEVLPLDDHDDFETSEVILMVVIDNPQDAPVTIMHNDSIVVIQPQFIGTLMITVERIRINIINGKVVSDGLSRDHVRKCEAAAVKEKNAGLTDAEKQFLASILVAKLELQSRIRLIWSLPDGQTGTLPFTHVLVDADTLLLLRPPPFSVFFSMEMVAETVWSLKCTIKSDEAIEVLVRLAFSLDGSPDECLLVAGAAVRHVVAPGEFETTIHCLSKGDLQVTGKFYIGRAYFVRRGSFPLI